MCERQGMFAVRRGYVNGEPEMRRSRATAAARSTRSSEAPMGWSIANGQANQQTSSRGRRWSRTLGSQPLAGWRATSVRASDVQVVGRSSTQS